MRARDDRRWPRYGYGTKKKGRGPKAPPRHRTVASGSSRTLQTSVSYQFTRTPKRSTRGATIAWMKFAFDTLFCAPRIACSVFELNTLKTSIAGMKRIVPAFTGRSTWKSRFWNVGRRLSPTGSTRRLTDEAPLVRDATVSVRSNGYPWRAL